MINEVDCMLTETDDILAVLKACQSVELFEYMTESLTDREKDVLYRLVVEGKNVNEIAEEFNVVRSRIKCIEKRAIHRLRHPERKKVLILNVRIENIKKW